MPDNILLCAQGSDEWKAARVGSLGASDMADMLARTKAGWGASHANLCARLVGERLTGTAEDTYQSQAMLDGIEREPQARTVYVFRNGVAVNEIGLIRHPTILHAHASPDGLVGDTGLVEIKCPGRTQHLNTLLGEPVAGKYISQMLWQMCCSGRAWCDYVSFHPGFPPEMQLFVWRLERDDALIADLEDKVRDFLAEVDAKVEALTERYLRRDAA